MRRSKMRDDWRTGDPVLSPLRLRAAASAAPQKGLDALTHCAKVGGCGDAERPQAGSVAGP